MEDDPHDQGPPVELSAEETMVMLGHFAGASFAVLSTSTGLSVARLEAIVTRLTRLGLIEAELIPLEDEPVELPPEEPQAPPFPLETDGPLTAEEDLVALLDAAMDGLLPSPGGAAPPPRAAHRATPPLASRLRAEGLAHEVVDLAVDEPRAEAIEETREYQKLFAVSLHPLPADERVALAGTVTGARLLALCFDPEPAVIGAILENTAATLEHARLAAFHHRTARGLEELTRRAQLASDPMVHRRLVQNPALNEAMFRRLMGSKRLLEIYKVALDRDVPDRTRGAARALFRSRYGTAQPEERVEIVWVTEGRVLAAMTGLTFDSRTTSILCSRTYASIMLVQSLARFPATPPALIAHLLRQPLVKRQAHLKNQLLQHPNTPSDAKRRS